MNNLGYVYTSGDPARLGDVLTWHDQGEFRVWVHSKAVHSGREIVSVEVQAIDENALNPSKEEQSLRLRLCAKRSVPKRVGVFKATTFRTLQTGQLLDEHSSLVSRIINQPLRAKIEFKLSKKLQVNPLT